MNQRLIDLAIVYRETSDTAHARECAEEMTSLILELAETDDLCMSVGPRIGGEGAPMCERTKGHTGNCNGFPGSGFEDVFWVN